MTSQLDEAEVQERPSVHHLQAGGQAGHTLQVNGFFSGEAECPFVLSISKYKSLKMHLIYESVTKSHTNTLKS